MSDGIPGPLERARFGCITGNERGKLEPIETNEHSVRGLTFMTRTFTSELKSLGDDTCLVWSPPLAGASIRFLRGDTGEPCFVFDSDDPDITKKYTFQRVTRP